MLAARKKKFQSARRMSRSTASASEFLIISQPCEYSSVSTRKDWGMMVPAFIMMVPAFMVPDNRVSPYVEDPAAKQPLQPWAGKSRTSCHARACCRPKCVPQSDRQCHKPLPTQAGSFTHLLGREIRLEDSGEGVLVHALASISDC